MIAFGDCVGKVAPYYNLVLVLIVLILFLKIFSINNKKVYILPWKLLFLSVAIYIIEEIITVFNMAGILNVQRILNAIFEFFIIAIFIYLLLLQKQHIESNKDAK
jgi:hypothetical protein